ncbi:MAG: orotate phosphoribosyltransferase [Promethearchaeota archaeon]
MVWKEEKFIEFILDNNVLEFVDTPFTLKSGRLSYWYINWRNISEDVFLLEKLTDFILDYVDDFNLDPDTFYGVPEGATKLGIITQYKWAKCHDRLKKGDFVLSMGRALPKDHGDPKDKYFLGKPRGKVVILEDTITTGESLLNTVKIMKSMNINIGAIICLSNRNELRADGKNIADIIKDLNIKFHSMSNAIDILPRAIKKFQLKKSLIQEIKNYFEKYGSVKLNLDT